MTPRQYNSTGHRASSWNQVTATALMFAAFAMVSFDSTVRAETHRTTDGRWLMDYGLAYANSLQDPTPDDDDFVIIWLTAATTLDPGLAEAYLWRRQVLLRREQFADADAVLDTYCRLRPADNGAQLLRIVQTVERAQTVEERVDACQQLLRQAGISPVVSSDLNRRLAELHLASGDIDQARQYVDTALSQYPQNVAARAVLAELDGTADKPATRLKLLGAQLAANPIDLETTWAIARLLTQYQLIAESAQWYANAVTLVRKLSAQSPPPIALMLEHAQALLADNQLQRCVTQCDEILALDPWRFDASLVKLEALRLLRGPTDPAAEHAEQFDEGESGDTGAQSADSMVARTIEQYRSIEDEILRRKDWSAAARVAWLAIDIQPDPERALRFAEMAQRFNTDSPSARRILGWALLISGSPEQAVDALGVLAESDPLAALGLARAHLALGERGAATKAIRLAANATLPPVTRNRVAETLEQLGQSFPRIPDQGELRSALNSIQPPAIVFLDNPAAALRFEAAVDRDVIDFDDMIDATVTLTNVADYPISVGEGLMVQPQVCVSVADTTRYGLFFDCYKTIELRDKPLLLPGQSVTARGVITVGAGRYLINHQPQREFDVLFNFVIDAMLLQQKAPLSRLGVPEVDIRLPRIPLDASLTGLSELARLLEEGDADQRIWAVRALFALMYERQQALVSRASYRAETMDLKMLEAMLARALDDPDPRVRANTLFGWTATRPGADTTAKGAPLITDSDWLVRLIAVEVFAKHHGSRFEPVLRDRAENDAHPLVGRLAGLYLKKISPPDRPR